MLWVVTVKTGKQWKIYWCFKKSDGHIANSSLPCGHKSFCIAGPFRSDQDKFSERMFFDEVK
jgi:hypothetical protein